MNTLVVSSCPGNKNHAADQLWYVFVFQVAVAGGQLVVIHTADSVVGLVASLGIHLASQVARIGRTPTVCHHLGAISLLTLGLS